MLLPRPEPHANAPPPCSPYFCTLPSRMKICNRSSSGCQDGWPYRVHGVVGHVVGRRRQVKTRRGRRRLLSSSTSILTAMTPPMGRNDFGDEARRRISNFSSTPSVMPAGAQRLVKTSPRTMTKQGGEGWRRWWRWRCWCWVGLRHRGRCKGEEKEGEVLSSCVLVLCMNCAQAVWAKKEVATLHLTTNSTISPGVESTKHSGEKRSGIPFSRRLGTVERADTDISHFRRRCAAESVSVWLALPYVSAPLTSNY